jgi:DNA-binding MarR family transcriptional regulator
MTKKTELLQELVVSLRAAQTATDEMDEAAAKALGINRTDGRCLDIIDREGPLTAGKLAERSGLTTAAVTAVLDRLEKAGYARRVADPADRRRVMVELTPLMRQRAAQIYGPLGQMGRETVEKYTIEELELLVGFNRLSQEINERRAAEVRELRFD